MRDTAKRLMTSAVVLVSCASAAVAAKPRCTDGCRPRGGPTGTGRKNLVRGPGSDRRDQLRDQYEDLRDEFYDQKDRYQDLTQKLNDLLDKIKDLQDKWQDVKTRWWDTAKIPGSDMRGVHNEWGEVDDALRDAIAEAERIRQQRQDAKDRALDARDDALAVKDEYKKLKDADKKNPGGSTPTASGTPANNGGSTGSSPPANTPADGGPKDTGGPKGQKDDVKLDLDTISAGLDLLNEYVKDPKVKDAISGAKTAVDAANIADKVRTGITGGDKTEISVRDTARAILGGGGKKPGGARQPAGTAPKTTK